MVTMDEIEILANKKIQYYLVRTIKAHDPPGEGYHVSKDIMCYADPDDMHPSKGDDYMVYCSLNTAASGVIAFEIPKKKLEVIEVYYQ